MSSWLRNAAFSSRISPARSVSQGHRSPSRAAARFGRARQVAVLSRLFPAPTTESIWVRQFGARLASPGVPGRAAAHPAHAMLGVGSEPVLVGRARLTASARRSRAWAGAGGSGALARAVMGPRLHSLARLSEPRVLAPANNSLQRTRVKSPRFFWHCGSPLSSISLASRKPYELRTPRCRLQSSRALVHGAHVSSRLQGVHCRRTPIAWLGEAHSRNGLQRLGQHGPGNRPSCSGS